MSRAVLLQKSENLHFRVPELEWLKPYLSGRTQCVLWKNIFSNEVSLENGVPQGSVLGPFVFLIYLNGLMYACRCSTRDLLADDTWLIFTKKQSGEELNKQITSIVRWLHSAGNQQLEKFFHNFLSKKIARDIMDTAFKIAVIVSNT